ncbi:MAG: hypothetical protein ACRC33_27590 [Gemmataceae bacterium]
MLARTWIALFRHIPPEKHPQFSLMTVNGTEISVQLIMRLEADFAIIKGRLSGSQDAGRVFFIPYASIDTFSYTNPVREIDVTELFDPLKFDAAPEPVAPEPEPPPVAPSEKVAVAVAGKGSDQGSGPKPAIRSEVLERFRSARPSSSLSLPRPVQG